MFTKVRLKNFLSFVDFEADFLAKAKEAKHLVLIYGENGAGKSNLVMAFYVLWLITQSFRFQTRRNEMMHKMNQENFSETQENLDFFKQLFAIQSFYEPINDLIQDYKTIESTGPMEIEVDFLIGNKPGRYLLQFSEDRISHERLEYASNLRRTVLYDVSVDDSQSSGEDLLENKKKTANTVKC